MVATTRTISLNEYAAANDVALRNGTSKQKRDHFIYIRLGPYLGTLIIFVGVITEYFNYRQAGTDYVWHGGGTLWTVMFGLVLVLQPWIVRRKIKKLYQAQQLDRPWTVEADEFGIRSVLPGLFDSRLEWQYFTKFAETDDLFVLINSNRPAFLSFPKRSITTSELEELRVLAGQHIAKAK